MLSSVYLSDDVDFKHLRSLKSSVVVPTDAAYMTSC